MSVAMSDSGTSVRLGKWYQNRSAAISLRFDDASTTHVTTVIPLLDQYDIKGTFMVNPGRYDYVMYKEFWEKDVPGTGHRLGNHTWNHLGANNLEEAEFEIGSVSKLIWSLYPNETKLNVFASGGGEKWGGELWRKADSVYKEIVGRYHLIDLYDGSHPSVGANKADSEYLCQKLDEAIKSGKYQAYVFHRIGSLYSSLKSIAQKIILGYDYSFATDEFEKFLKCLVKKRTNIWVAPIVDILKYETERENASLRIKELPDRNAVIYLELKTDDTLYDHPLTIVISINSITSVRQAFDDKVVEIDWLQNGEYTLLDVHPVTSRIMLQYN